MRRQFYGFLIIRFPAAKLLRFFQSSEPFSKIQLHWRKLFVIAFEGKQSNKIHRLLKKTTSSRDLSASIQCRDRVRSVDGRFLIGFRRGARVTFERQQLFLNFNKTRPFVTSLKGGAALQKKQKKGAKEEEKEEVEEEET